MFFTSNTRKNSEDAHAFPLVFPHMFVVHKSKPLFSGALKYGKSHPRPKHFLIRFEYIPNGTKSFMPILTSIHPYPTSIMGQRVAYGDEIYWFRVVGNAHCINTINYLASKYSKKQLVNLQGSKLHLKASWFSWLPICVAFFGGVVSKPLWWIEQAQFWGPISSTVQGTITFPSTKECLQTLISSPTNRSSFSIVTLGITITCVILQCQDHIVLFRLSKLPRVQTIKLPTNARMLQKGKS